MNKEPQNPPGMKTSATGLLRTCLLLGVALGFALVTLGWFLAPAARPLSMAGAYLILILYGLGAWFGIPLIERGDPRLMSIFGLVAGTIFALEIILEHILLPRDNTLWGLVEFSLVFFLFFLSSLLAAFQTQAIRRGILTAMGCALLSSLIWLSVVLVVFYSFRGSLRQELVFQAEGNYADFASSGMRDFNTFIMEDFMGATFFHLLLSPLVAVLLGAIGGALGKGLKKARG